MAQGLNDNEKVLKYVYLRKLRTVDFFINIKFAFYLKGC